MKQILIPFSGGLDSTYMTYKLLTEGNHITPIYFELKNSNLSKAFTEKQQAGKIVSMFIDEFPNQISKMLVVHISLKGSQWNTWVAGVKSFIIKNSFISDIAFGWNQSDLNSKKDLDKFRDRSVKFKREVKKVKAIFPIFHLNKVEINASLPQKYIRETFSCEVPVYGKLYGKWISRECGLCKSCSIKKKLGIFNAVHFDLVNQPSDEFAIDNNTEHRMYISNLNPIIMNQSPMHMNTNEIFKLK